MKDALGSVTDIADGSGNIVQRYDYSSFGEILNIKTASGSDVTSSAPVNTSYTFTGREWDEDVSLYYYRARWYDPSVGRFLQVDPDPGKVSNPITVVNKYAYVINQPTILTDPKGEFAFLAALAWTARGIKFAESVFNFSTGFFMLNAVLGVAFGAEYGNVVSGASGPFQGYVRTGPLNIFGIESGRGLTLGTSAGIYDGTSMSFDPLLLNHEYGHTIQFLGLTAIVPRVAVPAYAIGGVIGVFD